MSYLMHALPCGACVVCECADIHHCDRRAVRAAKGLGAPHPALFADARGAQVRLLGTQWLVTVHTMATRSAGCHPALLLLCVRVKGGGVGSGREPIRGSAGDRLL